MSRTILVLGGTRFLGRAVVDAALRAGDHLTLFNRGITNPDLYPDVETLHGDRNADLSTLAGREWDAVIDVAAYRPESVRATVGALAERVDRYVLVSTLSVYADHNTTDGQHEDAPVIELTGGLDPGSLYGARKAACERIVLDAYGDRAFIPRPGLIVGPHDPTDRFTYWPRRIARGGQVLAPGAPDDPVQYIDVRDLAEFVVSGVERSGVCNVAGPVMTMGDLLRACGPADLVWVPTRWLLDAGVDPWMGVPMWVAAPGWAAANRVDVTRALDAGLTVRPLADTVRDATTTAEPMFTADEERRLLDAYLN
ncbi:NAD-dependent epimerase/dehydratase family protein [Rugosimonospora africana]|uniref:Reductase n=1 Tax=Rugosimonospora africana TaxID=556532 RepID=A0A8J3QN35_9ACTN|nr:NAD-dependent epimerase/dehydratase family protein [Rugosimonospora africana]GIH12740.1 reductase [Rugosimonospora africana]